MKLFITNLNMLNLLKCMLGSSYCTLLLISTYCVINFKEKVVLNQLACPPYPSHRQYTIIQVSLHYLIYFTESIHDFDSDASTKRHAGYRSFEGTILLKRYPQCE